MNLLAVDVGNSGIKSTIFKNDKLSNINFFENADSLIKKYKEEKIVFAAISSVVPKSQIILVKKIKRIFGINPFIISRKIKLNLRLKYKTIETLGIDRICSSEGAFHLYKKSNEFKNYNKNIYIISIDCGTANTINVIKFPGEFIGGLIAPGFKMMFESLNKKTSQLPLISAKDFKKIIGDSTKASIASGVINSNIALIEKTLNELKKNYNAKEIKIFITGRNAELLIPHLNFNFAYEKGLVLYGINAIFKKNFAL